MLCNVNSKIANVNSKIVAELKTKYTFESKSQLVGFHDDSIVKFVNHYGKSYKNLLTKNIEGEDGVMLQAINSQEEDLRSFNDE